MTAEIELPCPAEHLIPHRNTMQLLQELSACNDEAADSFIRIPEKSIFVSRGRVERVAFIELAAQLCAAFCGFHRLREGAGFSGGLLVGLSDFCIDDDVENGEDAYLRIRRAEVLDNFSFFNCELKNKRGTAASGLIKICETDSALADGEQSASESFSGSDRLNKWADHALAEAAPLNHEILKYLRDVSFAGDSISAEFRFAPSFAGFDGHFPDAPVLPGILILKSLVLVSALALEKNMVLSEVSKAKFSRAVRPGETIEIKASLKEGLEDDGTVAVKAGVFVSETLCANFVLNLSEA